MPWPPKVFWAGLFIMYVWPVLWWSLEATMKANRIPLLPWFYTAVVGTIILTVIISVLYFYFPEKAEERRTKQKEKEVS